MSAAICLVVKNEVADLPEWIVHHLGLGFDRVVIYDNESDDGTTALISGLRRHLPIDHRIWPDPAGRHKSIVAYEDCVARTRGVYDWVAFLDADEFLVPYAGNTLAGLLEDRRDSGAVALNWLIFGSSGLAAPDGRLVMQAFTRRAPADFVVNRHVKCIVRPDAVTRVVNQHCFDTDRPCVDLRGEPIVWSVPGLVEPAAIVHGVWGGLHHYFLRTAAHWERRLKRGPPRDPGLFEPYDRNEELDESALPHAQRALSCLHRLALRPDGP